MATSATSNSPYARMRRRLFALCNQRFENASNLWLVYSSLTARRWLLRSDLQYLHFLSIEFAQDVRTFDLAPAPHVMKQSWEGEVAQFDGMVVLRDGSKEFRQIEALRPDDPGSQREMVLRSAAAELGGVYRRITVDALDPSRRRIQNSLRMLRFIAAAQHLSLTEARNAVIACLAGEANGLTLLELSDRLCPISSALVFAAVFRLMQSHRLHLEIDRELVTAMSLVKVLP